MDQQQFEEHVNKAISTLPVEFKEKLENVAVVVEDNPSIEQLRQAGILGRTGLLLGLYQGIPQTQRGAGYGIGGTLPDKITIFRLPILSVAQVEADVPIIIHDTLLHEIGHHFGMSEEMIRKSQKRSF